MTLENIIGVDEAAERLGLSPGTIKNMCAAGRINAKKIGKTWVLDETNLEVRGVQGNAKIYYEDVLVGEVLTNHSMSVDEALALIGFNEEEFLTEQGWDAIDYNEFRIEF